MSTDLLIDKTFSFKDVFVNFTNKTLSLGNDLLARELDLSAIVPRTRSFIYRPLDKKLNLEQELFDFSFVGYNFPGGPRAKVEFELIGVSAGVVPASWRDGEHVKVDIHIRENIQELEFIKSCFIYPGKPFLATRNSIKCPVSANMYWSRRARLDRPGGCPPEEQESRIDTLRLAADFKVRKSVGFRGRTDYTDDFVTEYLEPQECMKGNLLFCESDDCGIFFLQEAPPSAERRDYEDHDFRIAADNTVCSCCWGIAPAEVKADEFLHSYRTVIGIYSLGEDQWLLKKYLRLRFPETEDDYTVTVNPWGCGNFPELVNEEFFLDEIGAAGELNATHYQIDDGWQKGRALQELTSNNRSIKPDFWEISKPHLPHGFDNILEHAEESDVRIALWTAPSYTCEYRDWQKFADILFDFYQKYNIKMFKIDAVRVRTKEAEDNLEKLFSILRERSNGEIFFNLDTTNGQRPGYFMFLEYGNIFLENRYANHELCTYHPESTLKNLWNISKYVRPQILQIEVASPHDINYKIYEDKGLTAPDIYPLEYWVAITMFANPLIWLAPSQLPEDTKKVFRKMIDLHLKYRKQIFEEEIYPAGNEPDGRSLSGFIATDAAGTKGLILAFRELEGPESAIWEIPFIKGKSLKINQIAGNTQSEISYQGSGRFQVKLADKAAYAMFEFTDVSQ